MSMGVCVVRPGTSSSGPGGSQSLIVGVRPDCVSALLPEGHSGTQIVSQNELFPTLRGKKPVLSAWQMLQSMPVCACVRARVPQRDYHAVCALMCMCVRVHARARARTWMGCRTQPDCMETLAEEQQIPLTVAQVQRNDAHFVGRQCTRKLGNINWLLRPMSMVTKITGGSAKMLMGQGLWGERGLLQCCRRGGCWLGRHC
eukprot:3910349-Rhodomonas_salina.1